MRAAVSRSSRRGGSPTVKFAVRSAVALAALGAALVVFQADLVEERALSGALDTGTVAAEFGVRARLAPDALDLGLTEAQMRELDEAVRGKEDLGIRRLKIFNSRGVLVYSDDRRGIGRNHGSSRLVAGALAGQRTSKLVGRDDLEHEGERDLGQLMEVFVPLRYGNRVVGVAEVYLPYEHIAAAAADDRRDLTILVVGGLLVAWAVLLPIVRTASRRLARTSAENAHLALHDALTGLPNRLLAFDRIQQAIASAKRNRHGVGVVLIDLDRFKEVNDTLGHQHGDTLLVEVAGRLRGALREEDTVARLGGDEFALVLPRISGEGSTHTVVTKLLESLDQPVLLDRLAVDVRGSAGVALYPHHGDDAETLLRRADIAMYRAKAARAGVTVYDPALDDADGERLILLGELRDAIAADDLAIAYQPKVDVATGAVAGAEALVRWDHPRHGPIEPDRFVPLAEHTGLITGLTDWVLQRAVADCRSWVDRGYDFGVAVNLSPLTLHEHDLVDRVRRILDHEGLAARHLTLEITEGAVMIDPDRALAALQQLHDSGVTLAIDDFGTGYSSLAYLQRLPIDELKIDRTFVSDLGRRADGGVIVQSSIDLGRNLGLRVVAEGVEEIGAWSQLHELRCDVAQGYFMSRPVTKDELLAWVDSAGDGQRLRGTLEEA